MKPKPNKKRVAELPPLPPRMLFAPDPSKPVQRRKAVRAQRNRQMTGYQTR